MSFLAPLYLLAAFAVSLPLLFHLVRRTPQGRQVFSSVMFLSPAPPRMRKRNRIEDWLLLLLRAGVVCLLAAAFARPFLRAQQTTTAERIERQRIALLIDVSASMRAEGVWEQARQRVAEVVRGLSGSDSLMISLFDDRSQGLMSFEEWQALPESVRVETALGLLDKAAPGWGATRLGDAMIRAAEQLLEDAEKSPVVKTLVVVSDLQAGCGWESLRGFSWPEDVKARLLPARSEQGTTNASLRVIEDREGSGESLLVRVANSLDADREAFRVAWSEDDAPAAAAAAEGEAAATGEAAGVRISVPPGESRVVTIPLSPTGGPSRIVVHDDDLAFDNVCHVVPRQPRNFVILYLPHADENDSPEHLRFFLEPVFSSRGLRRVSIVDWTPENSPPLAPEDVSLTIVGGNLSAAQRDWIRAALGQQGQALFVARDANQATELYELLSAAPRPVAEVDSATFALWEQLDMTHPILRPFDDPRYADFAKLRFWRHRAYARNSLPGARTLAWFDDDAPALAEIPVGTGRVFLLASSWSRADSDLAVSSKFVPLMNGLLEYAAGTTEAARQAEVGDVVQLADLGLPTGEVAVSEGGRHWRQDATTAFRFERPGIFTFSAIDSRGEAASRRVAVNLAASESRTEPLDVELLESAGVSLDGADGALALRDRGAAARQRQLQSQELESQQQWWRWLIVAALAAVFFETLLAARRAVVRPA